MILNFDHFLFVDHVILDVDVLEVLPPGLSCLQVSCCQIRLVDVPGSLDSLRGPWIDNGFLLFPTKHVELRLVFL